LGAIFALFVKKPTNKLKAISIFSVLGAINIIIASIKTFLFGASDIIFSLGSVFQNVRFSLDNISAFFAIIIAIMSSLAIIYSNGYLKPYIKKGKNITAHCLFLIMLMVTMLGVVVCQNALMFLIIWESFEPFSCRIVTVRFLTEVFLVFLT
jgi:hydrogenase-4 component B